MVLIKAKVFTKSSSAGISSFDSGVLKVRLTSVPERGEANKELMKLISRELQVPKNSITIVKGERSRYKLLEIKGMSDKQLIERLVNS